MWPCEKKRRCQFWHRRFSSNFCEIEFTVVTKRSSYSYKLQQWSIWTRSGHAAAQQHQLKGVVTPILTAQSRLLLCHLMPRKNFVSDLWGNHFVGRHYHLPKGRPLDALASPVRAPAPGVWSFGAVLTLEDRICQGFVCWLLTKD